MKAETLEKIRKAESGFDAKTKYFGIADPNEDLIDFEFEYDQEVGGLAIEGIKITCTWCTAAKATYDGVSGQLKTSRAESYNKDDRLYVDKDENAYRLQDYNNSKYYFPIGGGNAIEKTAENDKNFQKFEGALDSKTIQVYFDDGEPREYYDENNVLQTNPEKAHTQLKINALIRL